MLIDQTESLKQQFAAECARQAQSLNLKSVDDLRIEWLGRSGKLAGLYENLKTATKEERPIVGKAINDLKVSIEAALETLKTQVNAALLATKLAAQTDVSLPTRLEASTGGIHPVTLMREALLTQFRSYGFSVIDGPELEFDFYNFSALNFPENHPSRDMQDTFFLNEAEKTIMRTHTSNVQVHAMKNLRPPLRFVAPGRVFRRDNDATHSPMFHQLEMVMVDRGLSFAHLKGIVDTFLKGIYGADLKTRFRPSFFPFVEPGAEVDLQCAMCKGVGCKVCKHTGWLEIGGCGMIHPNVFEGVGYDSEELTGFAFGFGIDRMAMLAYGLPDLRQIFEGNAELQRQFPAYSII